MPLYERLSLVISFTLIGLALYFIIDLPPQVIDFTLLGRPVAIAASQRLLMVVLLGGLAFTGAGAVVRSHPDQHTSYTVPFWVNAMLIVILATLTLAQLGSPLTWGIGLFVTGALLWFTILAEYYAIDAPPRYLKLARLWSEWISYALMLAYAIFMAQARIAPLLIIGTLSLLASLLSGSIFKLHAPAGQKTRIFALAVGLGLGQITWVLQLWSLSEIGAGLLTTLLFYTLCGLVTNHLQHKLSKLVLIEYGLVLAIGLWIMIQFAR